MKLVKCNWANYSELNSVYFQDMIKRHNIIPWSRKYEYPFVDMNINFADNERKVLEAGALGSILPNIYKDKFDYYALDIGSSILNLNKNFKCFHSDLCKTPFENDFFNIIICVSVFEHMPIGKWKDALIEFERVLKPSGRAIITLDIAYTDTCPFNFKYSEIEKMFSYFGAKIPEKPNDIINSDDSENGKKAGPGLQVLAFILEK